MYILCIYRDPPLIGSISFRSFLLKWWRWSALVVLHDLEIREVLFFSNTIQEGPDVGVVSTDKGLETLMPGLEGVELLV